jgi:hypothetical protein
MKLVMTLLVRDEIDILSSNISFHLDHGVDFIIATDNLSVDGTADVLRHYERRGLLHYIYEAGDDYAQHRWVTRMARLASTTFSADWVINSDADEFWCAERGDLKQTLSAAPPSCEALLIDRVNFLPRPMREGEFFADAMIVRERRSLNLRGLPLPGKISHRAFPDIDVEQGNHAVRRHDRPLATGSVPIKILHFPMRSYRQFANKISKGGAAYERNTHLPAHMGGTWRHLYEEWRQGRLETHYRARVPDDEGIERGLREGRFVLDERVRMALSRLGCLPVRDD